MEYNILLHSVLNNNEINKNFQEELKKLTISENMTIFF